MMRMFLINNLKKFKIYNKCPLHIYNDMNTLKIINALNKKRQGGGSH